MISLCRCFLGDGACSSSTSANGQQHGRHMPLPLPIEKCKHSAAEVWYWMKNAASTGGERIICEATSKVRQTDEDW